MSAFVNLAADPVLWNIIELRVQGALTLEDGLNRPLVNVFHFKRLSGPTQPTLQELCDSFATNNQNHLQAVLNVRVIDFYASARPLDDPLVPEQTQSTGHGVGAVTGDPLSASLAAVLRYKTGVRGRSFSGSKHFGGLSEDDTDGGDELNAASVTLWNTVISGLASTIGDTSSNLYIPCVLSSTLSRINDSPPIFTGATVTSIELNPILGTMRRRKERIPA